MTRPGALPGRQGAIIWAISTYQAAAPFRVVEHDGSETRYDSGDDLTRAVLARAVGPEFELAVSAKVRPVLLLQDQPAGRFDDLAALRLTRLQKFSPAEQERIRDQIEPTLLHLGHDEHRYGLDREYAATLTSLHRLHTSALVGAPVGSIDRAQFRTLCERLVRVADLDISNLVVREAAEFAARLRSGR